jgi:hypothetical protein
MLQAGAHTASSAPLSVPQLDRTWAGEHADTRFAMLAAASVELTHTAPPLATALARGATVAALLCSTLAGHAPAEAAGARLSQIPPPTAVVNYCKGVTFWRSCPLKRNSVRSNSAGTLPWT